MTDVALTLFVKENDGATNSWDDCVTTELEDAGGTGGGEGCKGFIVASWADDDVATVEDEGFAATRDGGFLTKLEGVVVVVGAAIDAARACSTHSTSRRPLSFCVL